ncbi:MAG: imelysin family protein [Pseudomonadota bacterium]
MRRVATVVTLIVAIAPAAPAAAEPDHKAAVERLIEGVARPGAKEFSEAATRLEAAVPAECAAIEDAALRMAFNDTWDAWMGIQHLRFGPIEAESRVLQIAFWPDSRGTVSRTVGRLLAAENAPVDDGEAFRELSVGGRGLPALERVLYDENGPITLEGSFRCAYAAAIARDLARLAREIDDAWRGDWGEAWVTAGAANNTVFLAPSETSQRLFAVTLGVLDETVRNRLGTPLGAVGSIRPRLAEAWRSDRSLRHIALVLDATEQTIKSAFGPELAPQASDALAVAYAEARDALARVVELGSLPESLAASRIRVEVLQQSVGNVATVLRAEIGPGLSIAPGFKSADGD